MVDFWGPLFGGIASSLIGGIFGSAGQESANEANAAMAQKQMDFQERMYKNRHTYEVEDLRRAGLNPILSANSAASAPMGAQAVMQNPNEDLARGISSSAKFAAELMLNKALVKTEETKQKLNDKMGEKAQADKALTNVETLIRGNDIPAAMNRGEIHRSKLGRYIAAADEISSIMQGSARTIRDLGSIRRKGIRKGDKYTNWADELSGN